MVPFCALMMSPRFAEFSRAIVQRSLEGERVPVEYYGMFRKDQKDIVTALEEEVYKHWDDLPTSPAKTRPHKEAKVEISGLKLLTCDASGHFGFPEHLLSKFSAGSEHHQSILKKKKEFENEFPQHAADASQPGPGSGNPGRISGRPDYTIENDARPIKVDRTVGFDAAAPPEPGDRTPHSI